MQRNVFAAVLTVVLLVGAVGAVPVGALSDNGGGLSYAGNDTAPGEQFAGSVSVGEAEVENDVEQRAFGHRLQEAENDSERAAIIAEKLNETEKELAELREQRAALEEAYLNGEISEREYRVRTAKIAATLSGIEGTANKSAAAAAGIPNRTLAANGVDAERIDQLRSNASELRGGEVAEIARNIAGPNAGGSPGERPSEAANRSEAGGPDERGNGSDAGEGGQDSGETGSQGGTDTADGTSDGDGTTTETGTATDGADSSSSGSSGDGDGSGTADGDGTDTGTADGDGTDTAGSNTDGTTTETEQSS